LPNNYYAPGFYGNASGKNDTDMLDVLYDGAAPNLIPNFSSIFGDGDYYSGIAKQYYLLSYYGFDLAHLGMDSGALEQSMISDNNMVHGTGFYPMISDSVGEKADVTFLKNKSMTKSMLDFTVGVPGLMSSNP
jgi:hypothetical protein